VSQLADPALEALWQQVVNSWDGEETHRSFLDACAISNNLAYAASCYRTMKTQCSEREEHCNRQLQAARTEPKKTNRIVNWVAFVVSLGLIGGSIFAMTR
jgi:hypothetical protein